MFIDPHLRYPEPVVSNAFNVWVDIHAPIERVFYFLTDEKGLSKWWTTRAQSEPRPGGKMVCIWESGGEETVGEAIFRQFEPPGRVVVEWTHANGQPILGNGRDHRGMRWSGLNVYELMQINSDTTRLQVHDIGINSAREYDALRLATQKGWIKSMQLLKQVAESERMTHRVGTPKRTVANPNLKIITRDDKANEIEEPNEGEKAED